MFTESKDGETHHYEDGHGHPKELTRADNLIGHDVSGMESASASPSLIEEAYPQAYKWARLFHELYEENAPKFGYATKKETKEFDPESPNGRLMAFVCMEVAKEIESRNQDAKAREDVVHEILLLITQEANIARSENEKTSRLTSLWNKVEKLKTNQKLA